MMGFFLLLKSFHLDSLLSVDVLTSSYSCSPDLFSTLYTTSYSWLCSTAGIEAGRPFERVFNAFTCLNYCSNHSSARIYST